MFKIVISKIDLDPNNINPNDIVLHNLKMADKIHSLELFICVSMGWFKLNKGRSYYDFEMYLRHHQMNTHLIAKKNPVIPQHCKLIIPGNTSADPASWMDYEIIFSCRPTQYALQEVLTHWTSLEENQKALKRAGQITAFSEKQLDLNNGPVKLADGSVIKKLPEEFLQQDSPISMLQENRAVIQFVPT